MKARFKQPVSVLVVLHDTQNHILLMERADRPGFWQSVTGSIEPDETPEQTALREVAEETGIILAPAGLDNWHHSTVYEIYPHWRYRYPPGTTHNTEHIFSACITRDKRLKLSEHTAYCWLSPALAAEKVFSPSNRDAIRQLERRRQAVCHQAGTAT